jgi:putative heme iron utilization protein
MKIVVCLIIAAFCMASALAFVVPLPTTAMGTSPRLSSPTSVFQFAATPNDSNMEDSELSEEQLDLLDAFQDHQLSAPTLDTATEIRTLVAYNHGYAVLSTMSKAYPGYPGGSVVAFAPDEQGRPLFFFSGMSTHMQDILVHPQCSLTVAVKGFKSAADARVNLMGPCTVITDPQEQAHAQSIFMKKHPNTFWTDLGDFQWCRLNVEAIRFVGGFARAGRVTAEQYTQAQPDPIASFGSHIAQHMNEDHRDATIAMVTQSIPGLSKEWITDAHITAVDSLGMNVQVKRVKQAGEEEGSVPIVHFIQDQPEQFTVRLPFSRRAEDRKDVKTLIVEMTQQATSKSAA